jgi:hypothetical protein
MRPRHLGHGTDGKARGGRLADQARPAFMIVAVLALAGCTGRWAELDPRPVVANIFGAHLEGREPPPGLDGAYPLLSSVPPRPQPPDPASRARVSSALAQDRTASRDPLAPGGRPVTGAAPPAPPRLAAVPPIRLDPILARPAPASLPIPAPAIPAPALPAPAGPASGAPAPEPPPPPSRDLFAPPPPPSRDLLAPRRDGTAPL